MTNTIALTAPVQPKIPTGQEIYNAIMAYIDPDLTTEGSKQLKEKYKNETPAQFAARKKRYADAYNRYDQAYQGYMAMLNSQVNRFRTDSFAYAEVRDRNQESSYMDQIASMFS